MAGGTLEAGVQDEAQTEGESERSLEDGMDRLVQGVGQADHRRWWSGPTSGVFLGRRAATEAGWTETGQEGAGRGGSGRLWGDAVPVPQARLREGRRPARSQSRRQSRGQRRCLKTGKASPTLLSW